MGHPPASDCGIPPREYPAVLRRGISLPPSTSAASGHGVRLPLLTQQRSVAGHPTTSHPPLGHPAPGHPPQGFRPRSIRQWCSPAVAPAYGGHPPTGLPPTSSPPMGHPPAMPPARRSPSRRSPSHGGPGRGTPAHRAHRSTGHPVTGHPPRDTRPHPALEHRSHEGSHETLRRAPWRTTPTGHLNRSASCRRAAPPRHQLRTGPHTDAAPSGTRRSASGHATPPPAEPPLPPRTPLLAEPRGTRSRTEPQTTPRAEPVPGAPRAEPDRGGTPCSARPTVPPRSARPRGTPTRAPRRPSRHPSAPYLLSITYRWAKSSSRRTCLIRSSTTREPCPAS